MAYPNDRHYMYANYVPAAEVRGMGRPRVMKLLNKLKAEVEPKFVAHKQAFLSHKRHRAHMLSTRGIRVKARKFTRYGLFVENLIRPYLQIQFGPGEDFRRQNVAKIDYRSIRKIGGGSDDQQYHVHIEIKFVGERDTHYRTSIAQDEEIQRIVETGLSGDFDRETEIFILIAKELGNSLTFHLFKPVNRVPVT